MIVLEIDKNKWQICKICQAKVADLAKIYGGSGIYYKTVFIKHLENDHKTDAISYFEKFDSRPDCPCGECGLKCRLNTSNKSPFRWYYGCGNHEGVKKWSKLAKNSRCGSGNPMFNKQAWNLGKKWGPKVREKMQASALNRIKRGDFKFTNTKPHKMMCSILELFNIKYENEKVYGPYAFDIYLIDYNILIEVDGDYFHCNPLIYKNGPINKVQEKAIIKDLQKTKWCIDNNITLLRFWEFDIYNNIESIKCKLKELLEQNTLVKVEP